jgi:hypothetical protein
MLSFIELKDCYNSYTTHITTLSVIAVALQEEPKTCVASSDINNQNQACILK